MVGQKQVRKVVEMSDPEAIGDRMRQLARTIRTGRSRHRDDPQWIDDKGRLRRALEERRGTVTTLSEALGFDD